MIRINLLPHREQKRQARQRQFVSLAIGLVILGLALVAAGARDIRRADREPGEPQQPAQGGDREARRADQGDRQAPRADAGPAGAKADRRDAAVQPDRSGPSARSDGAAASGRDLSQVAEADGLQGHARGLRAVERTGLDADAQHRCVPVAAESGAGRDQVGRLAGVQGPPGQRVHAQRPDQADGAARGTEGGPGRPARAGNRAPPPAKAKGAKDT